ncbi:MAG TPA: hypothetical protein VK797_22765 [Tepidisphaeraceae bacterium]|jgi:hypothetical protein|nr:hypothetical protein [Tepidisphaeraceae bacterium]
MPLSCDPTETFPVVLITDQAKPEETRPTFLARFVTRREAKRIQKLEEELRSQSARLSNEESEAKLDEALGIIYMGWKNLTDREGKPVEFKRDENGIPNFDDIIDLVDKYELLDLGTENAIRMHVDKKKALLLERQSAGANSASPIPPAAPSESASNPPATPTA